MVTAFDEHGNDYTIQIRQGEHPMDLQASDGCGVIRVSQGVYDVIRGIETIRVMSADLNAP